MLCSSLLFIPSNLGTRWVQGIRNAIESRRLVSCESWRVILNSPARLTNVLTGLDHRRRDLHGSATRDPCCNWSNDKISIKAEHGDIVRHKSPGLGLAFRLTDMLWNICIERTIRAWWHSVNKLYIFQSRTNSDVPHPELCMYRRRLWALYIQ